MNSTPDTPLAEPPPPPPPPQAKRSSASSTDRLIGGVCGGLGRYFGIDPTLVRIGMVALALLGGTGLIVYAAALVLVPSDGEVAAGPNDTRDRALAVGLAIVLTIVGFSFGLFGLGIGLGGAIFPIALLCVAGLAVWWLVSGERPSGSAGDVARRAALGIALLFGCFALSVGSFFASGLGAAASSSPRSSSPRARRSSRRRSSVVRAGSCCRRWRSRSRWRSSRRRAST